MFIHVITHLLKVLAIFEFFPPPCIVFSSNKIKSQIFTSTFALSGFNPRQVRQTFLSVCGPGQDLGLMTWDWSRHWTPDVGQPVATAPLAPDVVLQD